ncbi:MAG: FHA domain-containing protein, partial [Oscillospiraceae bacterium]
LLSEDVGSEGTTLLSNETNISYGYLIRENNQEKILINKPVFRIGKEKSYVDYFISDNNAVSRSHADFILKDGKCFILDHNSTNKTFIDGIVIESNKEVLLSDGMKIKLANEEFTYYAK